MPGACSVLRVVAAADASPLDSLVASNFFELLLVKELGKFPAERS
jgi:hypothetical protein